MVVSFGVAVVDPGLEHISGEIELAIADVPAPTSRVSDTTPASDRILIRYFLRKTSQAGKTSRPPRFQEPLKSVLVVSPINA
jgi:hypothetical protein